MAQVQTAPKLQVELVPSPLWGHNLRAILKRDVWQELSRLVRQRNDQRCELCDEHPSHHCHEVWEYDDVTHTQILTGLRAVCRQCHAVLHLGRTLTVDGQEGFNHAMDHLQRVNGWDMPTTADHIMAAFTRQTERSKHTWRQDLVLLQNVPEVEHVRDRIDWRYI